MSTKAAFHTIYLLSQVSKYMLSWFKDKAKEDEN